MVVGSGGVGGGVAVVMVEVMVEGDYCKQWNEWQQKADDY